MHGAFFFAIGAHHKTRCVAKGHNRDSKCIAKLNPIGFLSETLIVEGEIAAVKGNVHRAVQIFDMAIECAEKDCVMGEIALAHERAAMGGHVLARYNLGQEEYRGGNIKRAIRHWRIAAAAGFDRALMRLVSCFEEGVISLEELAGYMQARDKAAMEMNSDERNRAKKFLISIGA